MAGAVFSDVEGTLFSGSLPSQFIKTGYKMGFFGKAKLAQALVLNTLAKPFPTGSKPNSYLRYAALRVLMKGKTVEQNHQIIEGTIPALMNSIKPATLARLRRQQAEGLQVILVSAALHEAVVAVAQELGARGEGTKVEARNGIFTGRGDKPCQGPQKAERVKAVARELNIDLSASTGYGDTRSDLDFLRLVGQAVAVDPDPILKAEAEQRGWEVLLTEAKEVLPGEKVLS